MAIIITSWATHIQQHVTATYTYISLQKLHHLNSTAFISTIYISTKLLQHIPPCYITYITFFYLSCHHLSGSLRKQGNQNLELQLLASLIQQITCSIIHTTASFLSFEYIVFVAHHRHRHIENAQSRVNGTF